MTSGIIGLRKYTPYVWLVYVLVSLLYEVISSTLNSSESWWHQCAKHYIVPGWYSTGVLV